MSNEWTTIPFAIEVSTGNFVDVHEVLNGAGCGCICPSCSVPLVARQGNVKQWHFAHESRGTHQEARGRCDYSVFVAIKLMSRQLLAHGIHTFAVPELNATESASDTYGRIVQESGQVAKAQMLTIEAWRVEEMVHGAKVDAIARVNAYQLALLFDYPGVMPLPLPRTWLPSEELLGVLVIDLRAALACLWSCRAEHGGYRKALTEFLSKSVAGKRWLHHPREAKVREKLSVKLREQMASHEATAAPREVATVAIQAAPANYWRPSPESVQPIGADWHPDGAEPMRLREQIETFAKIVPDVDWTAVAEHAAVARGAGRSADEVLVELADRWHQSDRNIYSFLHRSRIIQGK